MWAPLSGTSSRAATNSQQLGPERIQPHAPVLTMLEWKFRKLWLSIFKLVTIKLSRFENIVSYRKEREIKDVYLRWKINTGSWSAR